MIFRSIELENAYGYRHAKFDLHPHMNMLFGPNGCCKSSLLHMANLLGSPSRLVGRDFSMLLRKLVFNLDYNPGYEAFSGLTHRLYAKATFIDKEQNEYTVELQVDPQDVKSIDDLSKDSSKQDEYLEAIKRVGIVRNDLPEKRSEYAFLTDADNPSNMTRFQIEASASEMFLDIAEAVYGYKCTVEKEVEEYDKQTNSYVSYFTDFVIVKDDDGPGYDPVRVHYRRMSDGERKIATLLRQMCSPLHANAHDVYLIDNLDLHVFAARQPIMVDKLLERFPTKQFITTAHSAVLIGLPGKIEPYLPSENLFDVIGIRRSCSAKKQEDNSCNTGVSLCC